MDGYWYPFRGLKCKKEKKYYKHESIACTSVSVKSCVYKRSVMYLHTTILYNFSVVVWLLVWHGNHAKALLKEHVLKKCQREEEASYVYWWYGKHYSTEWQKTLISSSPHSNFFLGNLACPVNRWWPLGL